jgi:hypothetical protein
MCKKPLTSAIPNQHGIYLNMTRVDVWNSSSMELEIWRSKNLNWNLTIFFEKIPWHTQCWNLSLFQNEIRYILGSAKRTNWDFVLNEQCIENLILPFYMILLFLLRSKYNVFHSKNYKIIECNIAYVIVFFQIFFKCFCSNFVNFKEEKKGSLVTELHLEFLLIWLYTMIVVHIFFYKVGEPLNSLTLNKITCLFLKTKRVYLVLLCN